MPAWRQVLCFLGWASLTRSPRALLVPTCFALALSRVYAPDLDRHLQRRYGEDGAYRRWAAPSLLPANRWLRLLLLGSAASSVAATCVL